MDGAVGSLDQLPAIVDAVGDKVTVLFDSGVRGGADAFKALALGAKAVLFGKLKPGAECFPFLTLFTFWIQVDSGYGECRMAMRAACMLSNRFLQTLTSQ